MRLIGAGGRTRTYITKFPNLYDKEKLLYELTPLNSNHNTFALPVELLLHIGSREMNRTFT